MAKTPSTKLFNLIHSLTNQEKRYFKILAKHKEDSSSKYIRLFDLIEKSQFFDDDYYKGELYPDLPSNSKKYSELKNYLFQFILRSLRNFDEASSVDYSLKNGLLNVHLLFVRSKFKYALDEANKLIRQAGKYEAFKIHLEALEWKKRIAYAKADIDFFEKKLMSIQREEETVLEQLENYKVYEQIFYRLYLSIRKKPSQKQEDLAPYISHKVLSSPDCARSFKALVFFHRIWSIYYFSIGKFFDFAKENDKLIHLIESNAHFLKEDIVHYIAALSNNSVAGFLTNDYSRVRDSLHKFECLHPVTEDDKIRINRQYYSNKFKLCILSGNFEEGIKALSTLRRSISDEHWHIFNNDSFLFQYFYLYFGIEDYETALDYLNEWTNLPKHSERQDMQVVARILLLIVHYELDNTMLLSSLIRSSRRFLNLKQKSAILEKFFLPAFSDIIKAPSPTQRKSIFQKLLNDIEAHATKSNPLFNIFDFKAWVEHQITKEKFADITKRKFIKQSI